MTLDSALMTPRWRQITHCCRGPPPTVTEEPPERQQVVHEEESIAFGMAPFSTHGQMLTRPRPAGFFGCSRAAPTSAKFALDEGRRAAAPPVDARELSVAPSVA